MGFKNKTRKNRLKGGATGDITILANRFDIKFDAAIRYLSTDQPNVSISDTPNQTDIRITRAIYSSNNPSLRRYRMNNTTIYDIFEKNANNSYSKRARGKFLFFDDTKDALTFDIVEIIHKRRSQSRSKSASRSNSPSSNKMRLSRHLYKTPKKNKRISLFGPRRNRFLEQ